MEVKFLFLLLILGCFLIFLFYRSRYSLTEEGRRVRKEAVLKRKELRSLLKEVEVFVATAEKYQIEPQPEGDLLQRAKSYLQKSKEGFKEAKDPRKRRTDPGYYQSIKINYGLYLLYAGIAREVLRKHAQIFERETRKGLLEAGLIVSSGLKSTGFRDSSKGKKQMAKAKHFLFKAQQTKDPLKRRDWVRQAIIISNQVISGNLQKPKIRVVAVEQEASL